MAVTYSPWVPEEPQQQAPQNTGEVTYEPWTPEPASVPQAAPRTAPQIQEAPSPGPTVFENAPGYTEQYVPEDMAPLERPDIAAFAEASWRSGVRDPAELNQLLGQMFPDAGVFNITPGQVAQLKQRDAYYEAKGQGNPGNFLFTPPTEEVAPADTVLGTAADAGSRSLANMANSVTGAAALATDLAGYDEVSEQLLDKYLEDSIKIQVNYPTRTYKDVDDLGEAGLYAVDILAETLPQLTGTLATGAVGSAAMQTAAQRGVSKFVKDRMEAGVSREVAEQQALAMVQRRAQQGMIAGTVGNTITQESGATMGQTYMETGERAPIMSLLAGGAAGSLDALAPLRALKTLGVGQQVTDQARQKLVRRITSEAGKQFLVEGGTEAVQEFIQSLPASIINGESPFTADMMDQMIEAFIRGGTGGSVVGGVTATFQGSAATKVPEQAEAMGESKQVFVNTTQRTNARKTDVGQPAVSVGKRIESITQGWTNAPDTVVVNNVEDLSQKMQAQIISDNAETAKGFYLPNSNTVIVLSDNIESIEDVDAMYFHEALGHAGLNQEFQTELSETLTSLYSDNQLFQADVDAYMNDTGETDLAIAVEEVMAEYSEGGFVRNKGFLNRLNTWLAEFTKGLPIPEMFKKGLETQQIEAILAQAHERIIGGEYQDPSQTQEGVRYIRTWTVSPAKYTNPDNRFMSTGEGGQARGRGQYSGTTNETRAAYIQNFRNANRDRKRADTRLRHDEHLKYFKEGTIGFLGSRATQAKGFLANNEWYNIPHLVYEGTFGDLEIGGFIDIKGFGRRAYREISNDKLFTPEEQAKVVSAFEIMENPPLNKWNGNRPYAPSQAFGDVMESVTRDVREEMYKFSDGIEKWDQEFQDLREGVLWESNWPSHYTKEDIAKTIIDMRKKARLGYAKSLAKIAVLDEIHALGHHHRDEATGRGMFDEDLSAYVYEQEIPDDGYILWEEPLALQEEAVYKTLEPLVIEAYNKRVENWYKTQDRIRSLADEDLTFDERYDRDNGVFEDEYAPPRILSPNERRQLEDEVKFLENDIDTLELQIIEDEEVFGEEQDDSLIDIRYDDLESLREALKDVTLMLEKGQTIEQVRETLTGGQAYTLISNQVFGEGNSYTDDSDIMYESNDAHQKLNEYLHGEGVTGVKARDGGSNWRTESMEELRILYEEDKAALYDEFDKHFTRIEQQVDKAEANIEAGINVSTSQFIIDDALKQFQMFKDMYEKRKKNLEKNYQLTYNYIVFDPIEMKVVKRYRLDDGWVPSVDEPTDLREDSSYVDSVAEEVVEYTEEQDSIKGYVRYMRDRKRSPSTLSARSAYRGIAGNVNMNRIVTKKGPGVYEWIQQVAEDAPELAAMDPADIDARARAMNLGLDEIREISRLDPAVAHAVGIALVAKAERVEYLASKIDNPDVGTDRDRENFAEAMLELGVIYEKYSQMANDAGRLLAAFKIAKQTSGAAGIRFMRQDVEGAVAMDIDKLAHEINTKKDVGGTAKKALKSNDVILNVLNLPRALMSSFDLSAPLRQGVVLIGRKEWWKSFLNMFRLIGSQKAFDAMMEEIQSRPSFETMRKAGLSLTRADGHNLSLREERFMSDWAERIWIVGRGVKASERAFVGFLNKLRADTFDNMLRDMANAGHDLSANDGQIAKDLASFINSATGRGPLDLGIGKIDPNKGFDRTNVSYSAAAEQAAPFLNGLLFSPRLIASRVALMNPIYYGRLSGPVRMQAIKSMLSFGGLALTAMALLVMAGFDVEEDPRSSDFGKIRDGTRRYDILGGFGQYITLGSRLWMQETKRISGEVKGFNEAGNYRGGWETATDFARNKASPVASFFADFLDQENVIGEEFELHTALVNRVTPLFIQDFGEAIMEEPTLLNAISIMPVMFGIGMSEFDAVPSDSKMLLHNNPDSPMLLELDRLREETGRQPITPPSGRADLEGDGLPARELTEEEYDRYVEIAEEYYLEDLPGVLASTNYQNATDENKVALVREMATKARKRARERLSQELFSGVSDDGVTYEEWTP